MAEGVSAAGGPGGPGARDGGLRRLPRRVWQRHQADVAAGDPGPVEARGTGGGNAEDKQWIPVTKLRCLVKDTKIKSLQEISFLCPSRNLRSLFLGAFLKDEVLKILPLQQRHLCARGPGSRHASPLGTTMDTLVWVSSAQRKQPLPSEGPSSWPSSRLSLAARLRGTKSASPTPSRVR